VHKNSNKKSVLSGQKIYTHENILQNAGRKEGTQHYSQNFEKNQTFPDC
jgi:hypothetical protein